MRAHRPTAEFPRHLEELYARFPFDRSLADDPIAEVRSRAMDPRRAEVAGVFASTLAIGNTTAIRGAIRRLAEVAEGRRRGGSSPRATHGSGPDASTSFRHRWIRGDQLDYLARVLEVYYRRHPSLESAFVDGLATGRLRRRPWTSSPGVLRGDALRSRLGPPPRGYRALFPSPRDPRKERL